MTSYEFEVAAKNALISVIEHVYSEKYNITEIILVSFSHVLGYKKATLIDTGNNNRYYEVTYNKEKHEMYVDVYDKVRNVVIPGDNLDYVVHE